MILSLALLVLASCHPRVPAPQAPPTGPTGGQGSFTVLHTNDMHAQFLPNPARWLPRSPSIGGLAALDAHVRAVREREGGDRVLLVDAGDLQTGTPLSRIVVDGARGGAMPRLLHHIGYDAWTPGNHDFDAGIDNFFALLSASRVPVVQSNLVGPGPREDLQGAVPSLVVEKDHLKVGLLGVITEELPRLTPRGTMDQVHLLPLEATLTRRVAELDPRTDVIVLLSHMGVETDRELAARMSGIDLIVGGHSHSAIKTPEKVGSTWIVQAGSGARTVGEVQVRVSEDAIVGLEGRLVDLVPGLDPGGPSEAVATDIARWQAEIDAEYGQVAGVLAEALTVDGTRECPMGLWVTDVLRLATGADVGAFNAGGMRASLPAGPVTRFQVFQAFPFNNAVVDFEVRGADLVPVVQANAHALASKDEDYRPLSGLTYRWRTGPSGVEVLDLRVGDRPLEPDRKYRVGTTLYLADQWSSWLPSPPTDVRIHPRTDFDVALEAVARGTPIQPPRQRATRGE